MSADMEILARERHAGLSWIVARNFHEGSCRSVLDRLAPRLELSLSVGFGAPIGKGWIEVQPAAALSGMQPAAGWRALVPSDNIIRPRRQFESMRRFSSYFDERGGIFSNWRRLGPAACSWSPLSGSTFDQAFGAVSGQRVGILCAEWED